MSEPALCQLCGAPMPPGEEVFNYHGYSGPCPKPPLPRPDPPLDLTAVARLARLRGHAGVVIIDQGGDQTPYVAACLGPDGPTDPRTWATHPTAEAAVEALGRQLTEGL